MRRISILLAVALVPLSVRVSAEDSVAANPTGGLAHWIDAGVQVFEGDSPGMRFGYMLRGRRWQGGLEAGGGFASEDSFAGPTNLINHRSQLNTRYLRLRGDWMLPLESLFCVPLRRAKWTLGAGLGAYRVTEKTLAETTGVPPQTPGLRLGGQPEPRFLYVRPSIHAGLISGLTENTELRLGAEYLAPLLPRGVRGHRIGGVGFSATIGVRFLRVFPSAVRGLFAGEWR